VMMNMLPNWNKIFRHLRVDIIPMHISRGNWK
jgi:hypothetical protein